MPRTLSGVEAGLPKRSCFAKYLEWYSIHSKRLPLRARTQAGLKQIASRSDGRGREPTIYKRACPCGGTGRRARLKIVFRKECGFDSLHGHHSVFADVRRRPKVTEKPRLS